MVPELSKETAKKNIRLKKNYGFLKFETAFTEEDGTLTLSLVEARELKPCGKQPTANSYVKCYLLPDSGKKSKRKTKIVPTVLNPVYNEQMKWRLESRV
jgi:synaptotagmin-like protein